VEFYGSNALFCPDAMCPIFKAILRDAKLFKKYRNHVKIAMVRIIKTRMGGDGNLTCKHLEEEAIDAIINSEITEKILIGTTRSATAV
jgi:hypothetical protein